MARMADVRARYAQNVVTTTPERLVTMLYDRLVRDLVAAEQAIIDQDVEVSNRELQHAQQIVIELLHALDVKAWTAAKELSALYAFVLQQLMQANARKDAEQVRTCRELIEPIAEAWHQAAGRVAAQATRVETHLGGSVGAAV
jgi:flagellar protein FliS